jgi:outer membrane lipoprotein SlyB
VLATPAFAQSTGQSVQVIKGVVSKVETIEVQTDDHSAGAAVAGGVVGYNLGSDRSQSEQRRGAVVGAGVGAVAGSPKDKPGVRYTVSIADGSSVAVVSSDSLSIKVGSCVSAEQSTNRSTIREVDQAICDLEKQTTVSASPQRPAEVSANCQAAQQQLLDAKTGEEIDMANSKIQVLCD